MTNQDSEEWLKTAVRKAATESLNEAPQDVIIRRSEKKLSVRTQYKPVYEVWALVKLSRCNHEILVDVWEDGSYSSFRIWAG